MILWGQLQFQSVWLNAELTLIPLLSYLAYASSLSLREKLPSTTAVGRKWKWWCSSFQPSRNWLGIDLNWWTLKFGIKRTSSWMRTEIWLIWNGKMVDSIQDYHHYCCTPRVSCRCSAAHAKTERDWYGVRLIRNTAQFNFLDYLVIGTWCSNL